MSALLAGTRPKAAKVLAASLPSGIRTEPLIQTMERSLETLKCSSPARRPGGSGASRLALAKVLLLAGADVGLVVVHNWSRVEQGSAYLWAIAFMRGREDLPPPVHVARWMR